MKILKLLNKKHFLIIKLGLVVVLLIGAIFLLSKIDFPAPKKEIKKVVPNENFKIVK